MCRRRRTRRGLTLPELLIVLVIAGLAATLALGGFVRSEESGAIRQAEIQLAAILEDAVLRPQMPCAGLVSTGQCGAPFGYNQVKVCFTAGSGTITEYATDGGGWVAVTPLTNAPLTLPAGVTVQAGSITFPPGNWWAPVSSGCLLVVNGGTSYYGCIPAWDGACEQGGAIWSNTVNQGLLWDGGSVGIISSHGMTATVYVGQGGATWWY